MSLGGGQSKGSSKSTSEAKTTEQKAELANMLSLYGPQMGQNENVWQGQRVTPFSDLQSTAISGAGNFADIFSQPTQVGTPLFQETGTALKDTLAGTTGAQKMGPQDVQDYFKTTSYDPTMQSLQRDVLPGIDESFAGPGFFASGRSHARGEAITDTRDLLAQQSAQLQWDVFGQNQAIDEAKAGRTLAAVPQAMQFGQVPAQEVQNNLGIAAQQIGGLNELFGIGSAQQTQEQAELQAEITRFAEENAITDPENLAILMGLLGLNFSSGSSQSSSSSWNANVGFA